MGAFSDLSRRTAVLVGMAREHRGAMVDNLETAMFALPITLGEVPVTRNDGVRTCYVCCPSAAYIDYALSELRHFKGNAGLSAALHGLVTLARPLIAATGIDRHLQLNNWLLATNPVLPITTHEIAAVTRELTARHPSHALIWRSLNDVSDAAQLTRFREAGYDLFPARQVYLLDCRGAPPRVHRDERRDRTLLNRGDYEVVGPDSFAAPDYARMAELYSRLYLEKYTRLNPQYSAGFMAAAHREGLLSFHGLRQDGRLDGVIGFFDMGEVMTAPMVGYDTSKPQELGLYRRLMAIGMKRARERRMLFNMSAGAAGFKRNRGAVPAIEHAAVHTRHLSVGRRAACWIVRATLEKVGRPCCSGLNCEHHPPLALDSRGAVEGPAAATARRDGRRGASGDLPRGRRNQLPHRPLPAPFGAAVGGAVVNGTIECPYHGWRYDGGGRCVAVPGHMGEVPRSFIPRHAVCEADGLVFVSLGKEPGTPYTGALAGPGSVSMMLASRVHSTLAEVAENILDATHTHYTHRGVLRGLSDRRYRVTVTVTGGDGWVEARYEGEPRQEGLVSRLLEGERSISIGRFIAPGIAELEFWGKKGPNLVTTVHLRQERPDEVRGIGVLTGPKQGGLGWLKGWLFMPFFRIAVGQDQRILSAAHRRRQQFGDIRQMMGPLDVMRPHIDAILEGKRPSVADAPVTLVMEL